MGHKRNRAAPLAPCFCNLMGDPMRTILKLTSALAALAAANTAMADTIAAAPDSDTPGLTDIVVTATKRETSLQKTPISMNVMSTEDIKKRHVQSLMDLADGSVPSLRISTFEARQSALTIGIRGIVPDDANQPAREQGVGVYLDGVYLGRQHGLNASLYDLERVEVLKGPQGTLFGRNTEGGALSMVLKAPTGKLGGRVNVGAGNFGAITRRPTSTCPPSTTSRSRSTACCSIRTPPSPTRWAVRLAGTSITAMAAASPPAGSRWTG